MSWNCFNISPRFIHTFGVIWKPYNCFNRVTSDGDHWWGIGLFQIQGRHLFYIGSAGLSVLFIRVEWHVE